MLESDENIESAIKAHVDAAQRIALDVLLRRGRQIWGDKKHTLDEIAVRLMVGVGDLARLARAHHSHQPAIWANVADVVELKKELGNIIFSTIRWIDDLGLDPLECLDLAIEAQEKFTQSGKPR